MSGSDIDTAPALTLLARRARDTGCDTIVPEWTLEALRGDGQRQGWPEDDEQWILCVEDREGRRGEWGPVSRATLEVVRLQLLQPMESGWAPDPLGRWEVPVVGRHRRGAHVRLAQGAVDLAVWDLSRARGLWPQPVPSGEPDFDMPGAARCYASALAWDVRHPLAPSVAGWVGSQGFLLQKWRLSGDPGRALRDIAALAAVVEAAGGGDNVAIDAVASWPAEYSARVLPALADLAVRWVEEPTRVPRPAVRPGPARAFGEHMYDLDEQIDAVTGGNVDIWQPDVAWSGGLTPALLVTRLARAAGLPVMPHGGSMEAGRQLASLFGSTAVPAVEYHLTMEPYRQRFALDPQRPVDGWILPPRRDAEGSRFCGDASYRRLSEAA